jgi:hypothetical protein
MDGCLRSVDLTGTPGAGSIYQDLSTVPSGIYNLELHLAGNPVSDPNIKEMQLFWDGSLIDTLSFNVSGKSTTDMGWTLHSYENLIASSWLTRLEFVSLTEGSYGPAIDNVRCFGLSFGIKQITDRDGGAPCFDCCAIDHRQPILNPDGTQIAFSSTWNRDEIMGDLNPERTRECFRYDIELDTFIQDTFTTLGLSLPYVIDNEKVSFLSTSPDLGINADSNAEIYQFDLTTSTIVQITNTSGDATQHIDDGCPIVWFLEDDWKTLNSMHINSSFEGKHIVWTSNRNIPTSETPTGNNADENYEIYWNDLQSSHTRQITNTIGGDDITSAAGANLWPRVNKDGSKIVFASNRLLGGSPISQGSYGLYLFESDLSIQRLTNTEIKVERGFPGFSMDSNANKISFASTNNLTGQNHDGNSEIFILDMTNMQINQITFTTGTVVNRYPVLSGDGHKLAYLSNTTQGGWNDDGSEELWILNLNNKIPEMPSLLQITKLNETPNVTAGRNGWMDWMNFDHDGSNLVFCSNADLIGQNTKHDYEIFLISIQWVMQNLDSSSWILY